MLCFWTYSFIINFVWPWKSKQRHLGCLFPSDLFFRVFYFSILLLSLNSSNLFSLSQVKSSSCLNPSCLVFEPCLLLFCSSLSLDIKTEASYLIMSSTTLAALHHLCSVNWTYSTGLRAARWCVETVTVKYSTKTKHETSPPNTYTTEMLWAAVVSPLGMHNIIPGIHLTSKKAYFFSD